MRVTNFLCMGLESCCLLEGFRYSASCSRWAMPRRKFLAAPEPASSSSSRPPDDDGRRESTSASASMSSTSAVFTGNWFSGKLMAPYGGTRLIRHTCVLDFLVCL